MKIPLKCQKWAQKSLKTTNRPKNKKKLRVSLTYIEFVKSNDNKFKKNQYALFKNCKFLRIKKKTISQCCLKNKNDTKNSKNQLITV